jgi:hypothetical protein
VTDVRISAQVVAMLGDEMVARVRQAPLAQARCPACRRPVPAAGPVNVILSTDGARCGRITFAHLHCAPSAVMTEAVDLSDALPDEGDMSMRGVLLDHGGSLLPALIAEVPVQAYVAPTAAGTDGEITNVVVAALLRMGLSLVVRLREAPLPLLNWQAVLTYRPKGPSQLRITHGLGDLFYEGTVPIPDAWLPALDRYGWCVLYSGTGLADPVTDEVTAQTLRTAAAAGTLAGARLRVGRPDL